MPHDPRSGRRSRLSGLIVSFPSSRRLAPTLESVRDWLEEMLVLDLTADGRWRSTARHFGARWQGGEDLEAAEAMGRALHRTEGEWILLLEADERLDWPQGGALVRLAAEAPASERAWLLTVCSGEDLTPSAPRHRAPRLVRRSSGLRFDGPWMTMLRRNSRLITEEARPLGVTLFRPTRPMEAGVVDPVRPMPTGYPARDPWLAGEILASGALDADDALTREWCERLAAASGEAAGWAALRLARSDWCSARRDEAGQWLQIAQRRLGESPARAWLQAELLLASGDPVEAERVLRTWIMAPGASSVPAEERALTLAHLARCAHAIDQPALAETRFQQALALSPRVFELHRGYSEFLMERGRTAEALEPALRAAAFRPDLASARRRAGEILRHLGRVEDGEILTREADRLEARLAVAETWIEDPPATIESSEARRDTGAVSLDQVAEDEPREPSPAPAEPEQLALLDIDPPAVPRRVEENPRFQADDAGEAGKSTEPLPVGDVAEAGTADDPVVHAGAIMEEPAGADLPADDLTETRPLAEPLSDEDRQRALAAGLEEELARNPDNREASYRLGLVSLALGDMERGEWALRQAVRQTGRTLGPLELAQAWGRVAGCSLQRGDLTQAVREARSALSFDPDIPEARLVVARVAYRQQRFADAAEELRRLLSGPLPDGVERGPLCSDLGVSLYRDGLFAGAAEAFAEAVEYSPREALLWLFLGNAQAHSGRTREALDSYREALRLNPALTEARTNFEVLALELGRASVKDRRHEETLELLAGGPETPPLLFMAAVAQQALGRLGEARRALEALNALDDNYADAHWNLALVCRDLCDYDAAERALLRFRSIAPADPRGRTLEEALRRRRAAETIS